MVDSTNLPEVDINQIATDLNNKMDRDGVNASCPTLLNRTANSQGGVTEIWSDGYCVQTGLKNTASGEVTITFDISFKDTDYNIFKTMITNSSSASQYANVSFYSKTVNSAKTASAGVGFSWKAEGYIR